MTRPTDPGFEGRVLDDARSVLREFCARIDHSKGADQTVVLTVRSRVKLSDEVKQTLEVDAARVVGSYQGLRFEPSFPVDPELTDPGFTVMPELAVGVPDSKQRPPAAGTVPATLGLLTLSYGVERHRYLMVPEEAWRPVRRPVGPYEVRKEILLPDHLAAIPREVLVRLWFDGERLVLDRTDRAREVGVLVDGQPIAGRNPNGRFGTRVAWRGTLSFICEGGRTDLAYDLVEFAQRSLVPGTQSRIVDGEFQTVLRTSGAQAILSVAPPPLGRQIRVRPFRLDGPVVGPGRLEVETEMLHTTAETGPGSPLVADKAWHVKLYRCQTPQHADFLRAHFQSQAEHIEQLNLREEGSQHRPPWAIAPVFVLDPGRIGTLGPSPSTDYGAPHVPAIPDRTLAGWFGLSEAVMGDCYVLVASRFLEPVQWPEAVENPTPNLLQLVKFQRMASGLDAFHRTEVAHCDVKPDNIRRYESDYVLVDGDSVTELEARPTHLPFTEPWARSDLITWSQAPEIGRTPLRKAQLVDHDRFAFALVVLNAVVDSAWRESIHPHTGRRVSDSPCDVYTSLVAHWGPGSEGLAGVLTEPFDKESMLAGGWTLRAWLDRAIDVARRPIRADDDAEPDSGRYGDLLGEMRQKLSSKTIGARNDLSTIHEEIELRCKQLAEEREKSAQRWVWIGSAVIGSYLLLEILWSLLT